MDKKSKAKYRTGRSIEEVIARRRLDGKQLPPLRSNSQSQSNFFSASQASFFKESRKFNDSGLDPFFNQKEEFDRSMDNRVAVVQTAAGEKALTKDEVISMLSDYCKHLESKLNPDNSAVRMFATPALRYTTSTRGSSYPTFTDTMIKKEQAENEDIFPAPPITAGATMAMPVQIAPPTANFHSHGTTLHHTHHGHGNTRKSEAMHELHSDIHDNLGTIDIKVGNLRQIFRDGNPLEDRRIAITKINAQVRGWLVRCRLGAYRIGLKEWKISRTRRVIFLLNVLCANYVEVTAGVELMIMNRNTLTCLSVFQKWLSVSRSTAPLRRKIRQAAENMAIERKNKALRDMFNALKSVCVGKMSRIQANKERRILIDRIRLETSEKLKKQGMCGVVSQIDLDYALNREILQSFLAKKALLAQKTIFSAFQIIVAMARKKLKTALQFRFRQKAGKCFYAWSDHIYLVGVGLDRKRWAGPRKYEIRYNQKLVDHFARLRRERFVFTPWKQFFYRMMNVKRMNQKHVARFVSINFSGWKRASQYLRNLRKITLTNWKLYPKLLCEKPFRAWSKFIVATKNFASEQTRIVNAYIRWKGRQKLSLIIRTWRHQAIYGRIDGMYTRRMLITSLSEQKLLTSNLEKMLSTQTLELESCKLLLETEIGKRNVLEETVTNLESDITKHRMIEHHLEQETIRLESIIDAMALINPRQVEHLRNMQIDFKFKARKVVLAVPPEDFESSSLVNEEEDDRPSAAAAPIQMPVKPTGAGIRDSEVENAMNAALGVAVKEIEPEHTETSQKSATANEPTKPPVADKPVEKTVENPETAPVVDPSQVHVQQTALPIEDRLLLDRVKWFMKRFKTVKAPVIAKRDFFSTPVGEITEIQKNSPSKDDFHLKYDKLKKIQAKLEEDKANILMSAAELTAYVEKAESQIAAIQAEIPYGPLDAPEIGKRVQLPSAIFSPPPEEESESPSVERSASPLVAPGGLSGTNTSTTASGRGTPTGTVSRSASGIAMPPNRMQPGGIPSSLLSVALGNAEGQNSNGNSSVNEAMNIAMADGIVQNGVHSIALGARPDGAYPDDIAKTMLSMMTFLEAGDTGGLAPVDRKNWIKYVYRTVEAEKEKEEHLRIMRAEEELKNAALRHKEALEEEGKMGPGDDHATKTSTNKLHHSLHREQDPPLANKSWRNSLLYLRAVFPTTASLEPSNGLFVRIADMRDNANRIMDSRAIKHIKNLREKRYANELARKKYTRQLARTKKLLALREQHKGQGLRDDELLDSDDEESDEEIEHDSDSEEEIDLGIELNHHPPAPEPVNLFAGNIGSVVEDDKTSMMHDRIIQDKLALENEAAAALAFKDTQ